MMNNFLKKLKHFFVFLFLSITTGAFCLSDSKVFIPELTGRIVDNARIIEDTVQNSLESYVESLDKATGIEIVVLTVNSSKADISIEEYAAAVFKKYKPGKKGTDNGVLLVVRMEDRAIKIETGYGLEGILTDTKCGIIIRNFIIPEFQQGNFTKGINDGVKLLAGYASGNAEIVEAVDNHERKNKGRNIGEIVPIVMFLVFFLIVFTSSRHGGPRGPGSGFGGGFYGGYGGFGGFGGHGSGFGGGGFHGGGGRSGGGGASGHW